MDCGLIEERNRLARTIALLLSLAFMAMRTAFSPASMRRELIYIIRAAEASGLRLAASYGDWEEGTELPDIGDGYTRDDALRLAVSLRATAMALWFHLQRFNADIAAVREWVAPDTLKAGSRWFITNQQHQCRAKIPLIDTAPDPPPRSGARGTTPRSGLGRPEARLRVVEGAPENTGPPPQGPSSRPRANPLNQH